MRARLNDLVLERLAAGSAVPAFTCYDFTTALAVVSAAEDARLPVILLVAPKTAAGPGGLRFIRALRGLADDAAVPVVVQLDHATDPGLIQAAVTAGADAVLADGSRMPPVRNAEFVASIASLTSGSGVVIEAELGALGGDEDDSRGAAKHDPAAGMTDPAAVAAFLDASAADLLAVAVGNVHGNYSGEPKLDWERISRIRTAAGTLPLVLHGASGLSSADLERAASAGIGKVNVNTELRTATLEAVAAALPEAMSSGANMLSLMQAWSRAAGSTAEQTLKLLNAAG
jgi:tagatose 1,6-diphosphate aldolase GatY/KbaY